MSVTVPDEGSPPLTVDGLIEIDATPSGDNVRFPVTVMPSRLAETVATVVLVTVVGFAVNVPLIWPGEIVIVDGIDTNLLLLASPISSPAGPAGPLSETIPVDVLNPDTMGGLNMTDTSFAKSNVNVCCNWPFMVAVIIA
jgi:hypothetical protein